MSAVADRFRRLQQATAALSRAGDAGDVARELARGITTLAECDGTFVAHVDVERDTVRVICHLSRGAELDGGVRKLGDGAMARVARSGEPWAAKGEEARAAAIEDGGVPGAASVESLLLVPVMHGRQLLGLAGAYASRPKLFDDSPLVDAIRTLATQAGTAMSNAQLFAESERERRQTEALADAARAVSESLRMGEVLRLVLRHATGLLHGDGACVALREGHYLNVVAAVGTAKLLAGVHLPIDGSLAGRAVRDGTAMICNDVPADPLAHHPSRRWAEVSKAIFAPLTTARGVLGVLMVFNRAEDFGGEDARVLQRLADQVAVAIVNARLFEEVTEASRAWTATFEAIAVGMAIVDGTGCIVRYNARARELAAGRIPRELSGLPFYEAVLGTPLPPNDFDPIGKVLQEGTPARARLSVRGTRRVLQVSAAPHRDVGAIVTFDTMPDEESSQTE